MAINRDNLILELAEGAVSGLAEYFEKTWRPEDGMINEYCRHANFETPEGIEDALKATAERMLVDAHVPCGFVVTVERIPGRLTVRFTLSGGGEL